MKISIHQPNFIPNFPFFYKMAMSDVFIILSHVDFEKNNFQNRYLLNASEKWVTKSVSSKFGQIFEKKYADGKSLLDLNMKWIYLIKETLGIDTKIVFDHPTDFTKTDRLVELIVHYGGDTYVTNPSAKEKYLNEELMKQNGIAIEYCRVPKHLQIHTFEAFEKFGIDGCIKQLPRKVSHETPSSG